MLAAATALQPPPDVGPRACRKPLREERAVRSGQTLRICVLDAGGALVFVSRVGKGPRGGRIISLVEARARYASLCLAGPGRDYVVVGRSDDPEEIRGSNAGERTLGLGGPDVIEARRGDDCVDGGAGDDSISGGGDDDFVLGGDGDDRLEGGSGSDALDGRGGDDVVRGGAGDDRVRGGAGNDTLRTGGGADLVDAGPGDDSVEAGQPGARRIDCGPGRDRAVLARANRRRARACEDVTLVGF